MILEFFLLIVTLLLVCVFVNRKPKNLPPGEWGLPVVGYAPFTSWRMTETLRKLQQKHGNIFTLKLGSKICIILSDYILIKSAFQRLEFSGRPFMYHFQVAKKYYNNGIAHSDGKIWTVNRKFALKALRDFGFGKAPILDEIILNEAYSLVQDLKENINKPFEVKWNVNVAILNVIWNLVASRRYDIDDKEILKFSENVNDLALALEGPMAIFTIFPWLAPLVPRFVKNNWMGENAIKERRDGILSLLEGIIKEHKERLDPKNPRDMIDKYLIELEEQKNNPDNQHWGDRDLLILLLDFFLAGSETTSSTLRWFFLYMAKYQNVQKKIQKEIDEMVMKGQQLSLHDKEKLPLLEALTFEINRKVSLAPTGIPHEVKEDSVFEGYNIPKGTWLISNIDSCHKNPKYWKDSSEFCIENFLDENGKAVRNKEGYLPFSLGRRSCLGESLANMELFVFMGAILQTFEISEPVGQVASFSPNETINFLNLPTNFEIILKLRN